MEVIKTPEDCKCPNEHTAEGIRVLSMYEGYYTCQCVKCQVVFEYSERKVKINDYLTNDRAFQYAEFMNKVQSHLEIMAAAYLKSTNIPADECELVVSPTEDGRGFRYYYQRRIK